MGFRSVRRWVLAAVAGSVTASATLPPAARPRRSRSTATSSLPRALRFGDDRNGLLRATLGGPRTDPSGVKLAPTTRVAQRLAHQVSNSAFIRASAGGNAAD